MATKTVGRCGIWEKRPDVCRKYPQIDHYIPEVCTYYFAGSDRRGECACDESACCAISREGGEPGGAPLPEIAGGEPCKHIVWEDQEVKEASELLPVTQDDGAVRELLRAVGRDE